MKITAQDVELAAQMLEAEFRDDYVGRGFDRKPCVGIVTDLSGVKVGLALAAAVTAARVAGDDFNSDDPGEVLLDHSDDLSDLIDSNIQSDSMGLAAIYYFPGVRV